VVLLLGWLAVGTAGLAITVASLVAGYQPVTTAEHQMSSR
jgi:hypothetical protein